MRTVPAKMRPVLSSVRESGGARRECRYARSPMAVPRLGMDGCRAFGPGTGLFAPGGIAVDAESVYFTNESTVMKVPIEGGTAITLASELPSSRGFVLQGQSVYWTADDSILRVGVGGGAVATIESGQFGLWSLASDATSLFLMTSDGVAQDPTNVLNSPLGGGAAVTLAAGAGDLMSLAADATGVYWTSETGGPGGGALVKAPLAGGPFTTLASGLDQPIGTFSWAYGSGTLVTDPTSVYTISGDSILRIAPK